MKWINQYLREIVRWSFTQWRIHMAVAVILISLSLIVRKFTGISWLNILFQAIFAYSAIWFIILIFLAPACLWHQLDERLRLISQHRPLVIIDGYEGSYEEDDLTGEERLVEMLHIVNRGDASAVSITIPPIQPLSRTSRILVP